MPHYTSYNLGPILVACPTSFEGGYGRIRYHCEANIDRPWKFDNEANRPFTVIGMHDLNSDPVAIQPVAEQNMKTLGSLCCVAGNVTAVLKMPKRGFVAGEPMPFVLDIQNESTRTIKKITARLIQHTQFLAAHGGNVHTR